MMFENEHAGSGGTGADDVLPDIRKALFGDLGFSVSQPCIEVILEPEWPLPEDRVDDWAAVGESN